MNRSAADLKQAKTCIGSISGLSAKPFRPVRIRSIIVSSGASDHMLVAEYSEGRWQEPRIMPFEPLPVPQSMAALHYGQSIFEGLKVYRRRRQPRALPPLGRAVAPEMKHNAAYANGPEGLNRPLMLPMHSKNPDTKARENRRREPSLPGLTPANILDNGNLERT